MIYLIVVNIPDAVDISRPSFSPQHSHKLPIARLSEV